MCTGMTENWETTGYPSLLVLPSFVYKRMRVKVKPFNPIERCVCPSKTEGVTNNPFVNLYFIVNSFPRRLTTSLLDTMGYWRLSGHLHEKPRIQVVKQWTRLLKFIFWNVMMKRYLNWYSRRQKLFLCCLGLEGTVNTWLLESTVKTLFAM